jgi:hypothetical protein
MIKNGKDLFNDETFIKSLSDSELFKILGWKQFKVLKQLKELMKDNPIVDETDIFLINFNKKRVYDVLGG